jgi:segregation and condensation protein B
VREGRRIDSLIESLLFVAGEPVTTEDLARVLDVPPPEVEIALARLGSVYRKRGLRLQRRDNQVQMVSAPECSNVIERFFGLQLSSKLSPAALETLAIIAYQQPITRPQTEAIRGVNCDGVIRTLLARGLVEEVGRLEQAGRPILYGTTFGFLQYFGLSDLSELSHSNGRKEDVD